MVACIISIAIAWNKPGFAGTCLRFFQVRDLWASLFRISDSRHIRYIERKKCILFSPMENLMKVPGGEDFMGTSVMKKSLERKRIPVEGWCA